ncbi:type II toxin-antitoxin system RelE/ParE family toxin [Xanthobacter autotrophicus]|uniref:type II toxin-antitoxin system RelE family toxin n=1 Tax=Xanthobacter autotrophicus TaxID=280 RepID=UPI0037279868
MKEITYSRAALKVLTRLPANVSRTILAKIEQYAADPASLANNVSALKGEPGCFRLRIGDWRVVFSEDGTVLAIIRIAPRGSAYE